MSPTDSIRDFLKAENLDLLFGLDVAGNWMAQLSYYGSTLEVKEGPMLVGAVGRSATIEGAVRDMLRRYSGQLLVATERQYAKRKEIRFPIVLEVGP